jgi:NAD-dependent SIR2 family protein deacetylase
MGTSTISDEQSRFLRRAKSRQNDSDAVAHQLWTFLKEKPQDEELDPEWIELWENAIRQGLEFVPSEIKEALDEAIGKILVADRGVSDLDLTDETKVVFFLGAGASQPSGIPTVDKLLGELWRRAKKIGREDLDRLSQWCEQQEITNIEDLLTSAYISNFSAKNRPVIALLDYFLFNRDRSAEEEVGYYSRGGRTRRQGSVDVSSIGFLQETLQTLFGLLTSTMIVADPNPAHHAIADFMTGHEKSWIVTTNYDGCMDEALIRKGMALPDTLFRLPTASLSANRLMKMHGSFNWASCDSCQDLREFDLIALKQNYSDDKQSYPVICICKNCGGLRRPLLVPPLSLKFMMFPNLIDIWKAARECIENADIVFVIGYSFAEADSYIAKMVSRAMAQNDKQRLVVVNTDPKLVPNLRTKFSAHIDGFNTQRILRVRQSCDTSLPKILSEATRATAIKTRTRAAAALKKQKAEVSASAGTLSDGQ